VKDGRVVRVEVTDGGAGYSSAPEVTVEGTEGVKLIATVSFGIELETNGSVKQIAVEER
jgi:hypothetical protein